MSRSQEFAPNLLLLMASASDGTAIQKDLDSLERMLLGDIRALHFFLHLCQLESDLVLKERTVASTRSVLEAIEQEPSASRPSKHGAARYSYVVDREQIRQKSNYYLSRWSAGVAVSLLLAYFVALVALVSVRQPHEASSFSTAGEERNRKAVGVLISTADCQWEGGLAPKIGDDLLAEDRLCLKAGVAGISLRGVRTLIEGPALIDLSSADEVFLYRGKLAATVSAQGVGFAVKTPSAHVIDLGTEFAVEVDGGGETTVQVFRGIVSFAATGSNEPGKQNSTQSHAQQLRAGEAARTTASASTVVATKFIPDKFARQSAPEEQHMKRTQPVLMVDLATATATQSSEVDVDPCPASAATDGKPETFMHTAAADAMAWWQVDLGNPRSIAIVVLQNREDCCGGRLRDITVKILGDDGKTPIYTSPPLNENNSLGEGEQNFKGGPRTIVADILKLHGAPVTGRFVRIERTACKVDAKTAKINEPNSPRSIIGEGNILSMSEVRVYEVPKKASSAEKP